MNTEDTDEIDILAKVRASRGAQLRALILAWHSGDTYQNALQEQATALREGELEIADDWSEIADQILKGFVAQRADPVE